jgi:tetratricopeptide (TPR) repeat protein
VDIAPDYVEARLNLGNALIAKGDREAAITQFQKAVDIAPDYVEARLSLGNALFAKGNRDEAIAQYRKGPGNQAGLYGWPGNNLGDALLAKGDLDAAIAQYQKALETEINAGSADTCLHLGLAYMQKGQTKEALDCWEKSLALKPGQPFVQNNLAWALATTYDASLRDGARAMALATQANQASGGGNPEILHTLAAACAEAGNYDQAAITARRALDLAVAQKNDALAAALQKEIQLYQANTPMRDGPR